MENRKLIAYSILLVITLAFTLTPIALVEAKVLPQAVKSSGGAVKVVNSGITVYPKLRADRRALNVTFGNLLKVKAVSYSLTYNTLEQQEGAMGAVVLTGASSQSQELLFGTCSKGVCRYHTGIKNVKLEVSYTTKSGKKYLKRYKIRV